MIDSTIWTCLGIGYLLTWLLIPWVLLKPSVHSSATVALILSIVFIPYLGSLLCVLVGTTRWKRRWPRKRVASAQVSDRMRPDADAFVVAERDLGRWQSVARLVAGITGSQVRGGNAVNILPEVQTSFSAMQEVIEAAKTWIHVEFYIWKNDTIGTRMRDLLIRQARSGVQVRFLYDGLGSVQLTREFLRPLKQAGVQVASFVPGWRWWQILTVNLRNHRKLIVTDQQAALTGGINMGDEYVHRTDRYGKWRDTEVLVHGSAALQVQLVFAEDWLHATSEELAAEEFWPAARQFGDVPAQVVVDGPDWDARTLEMLAVAALGQAQERATITTPYFVPPDSVAVALAAAARRGVRVRLLVAGRGNFILALKAGRSYYQLLLDAGVEVYEYQRGLYHAKTLSIDGKWGLVGTPNWDYRSVMLNFELAIAIFAPALAEELDAQFEKDREFATRIEPTQWQERSKLTVLNEQFWRLFAPIL